MHNHAALRLVLWSVVALLLVAILLFFLLGGAHRFKFLKNWTAGVISHTYPNGEKYTVGDTTLTEPVRDIRINWISGTVTICVRDDITDIRLTETIDGTAPDAANDPDRQMHWLLDDHVLYIQYCASKVFTGSIHWGDKQLTVEIPAAYVTSLEHLSIDAVSAGVEGNGLSSLQELEIDSVSGSVQLQNISSSRAKISTVSGEIRLHEVAFDTLDLDTTSGKAEISGCLGRVKLDTTSGALRLTSRTPLHALDADTVSGDIDLYLPEDTEGFTVNFDHVSGKFSCAFPMTSQKDTYIYGKGVALFAVDTVSGDVRIHALPAD